MSFFQKGILDGNTGRTLMRRLKGINEGSRGRLGFRSPRLEPCCCSSASGHSDPGWMHHNWVASQTCILTNRDANGRLNAAAAAGGKMGEGFSFSLFCTLKNQGPVTAGGPSPQNAELARFTLLSLFCLPSIHTGHRTPQQASLALVSSP